MILVKSEKNIPYKFNYLCFFGNFWMKYSCITYKTSKIEEAKALQVFNRAHWFMIVLTLFASPTSSLVVLLLLIPGLFTNFTSTVLLIYSQVQFYQLIEVMNLLDIIVDLSFI